MSLSIRRSCLEGTIVVPPSKSHTLRSLIFAFMAHGKSKIINPLHGKDTFSMLKVLSQLGALVAFEKENLWITGIGKMMPKVHEPIINAGNSGQILRFITPLVSLFDQEFTITG
ncbi:MAG: 3-phosphoshikimate 1-carboxyvinyltransferase, partial [Rhabdochlamydiaceae bacterium]